MEGKNTICKIVIIALVVVLIGSNIAHMSNIIMQKMLMKIILVVCIIYLVGVI